MDTEAALLRAIIAAPADDLPRLVYADWLEEHPYAPCPACGGSGTTGGRGGAEGNPRCPACDGAGRVDAGRRELAAYIRHHIIGDSLPPHMLDASPDLQWVPPIRGHTRRERTDGIEYLNGDGLNLTLIFRRGFVAEVRAPLAVLVGGECWCRGELSPVYSRLCPVCHGTGTTTGILRELVAAHPLEFVGVTDREPHRVNFLSGRVSWNWYMGTAADAANIPLDLFTRMGGHPFQPLEHPTREDATAAVSAALLNPAREAAGLPPLTARARSTTTPNPSSATA